MRLLSKWFGICIILILAVCLSSVAGAGTTVFEDYAIESPSSTETVADAASVVDGSEFGFSTKGAGVLSVIDTSPVPIKNQFNFIDDSLTSNCASCHVGKPDIVQRE